MTTAVLLIAHGSKQPAANQDLEWLADELRAGGAYAPVEFAYLQIAQPTIPEAARRCAEQGATEVLMLPYLLSAGVHATRDLERFRQEFAQEYSAIRFVLCAPLGPHPLMVRIVEQRLQEGSAQRNE